MIFILAYSLNMDVVILRKNIMVSDKSFHLKYTGNIDRGIEDRDQSTWILPMINCLSPGLENKMIFLKFERIQSLREIILKCRNCSYNLQFRKSIIPSKITKLFMISMSLRCSFYSLLLQPQTTQWFCPSKSKKDFLVNKNTCELGVIICVR